MKAIIIAAGKGRRMRPLTDEFPKCMLEFNGKTLLERHIEVLNSSGIKDISVVRGYLAERICIPGIKYYQNDRYEHNNILNSLFYAEAELNDDVVISYCDIYYERPVLSKLLADPHDISIVIDLDWRASYAGRSAHPVSEAEKVRLSSRAMVMEIGKSIKEDTAEGEFLGLMKLSKKGCMLLKEVFHSAKNSSLDRPFHEASVFEKAYLTDMIQELADRGINVHCVGINGGWKEIDTIQDYENAKKMLLEGGKLKL